MIEATNRSRIPCEEHPSEQITNYCCNLHCLRPLCPDCVEVHTKSHSKQQIESWKHCIYNTNKQLKSTYNRLQQIQSRLGNQHGGRTIQAIEEEAIRNLDNLRRQIHQLVDQSFNHHEKQIRNIIRNEFRTMPIDLSKLRAAIDEIQKLIMKLSNSNTVMAALKKSILLDHQSLVSHFEQQYRNSPQKIIRDEFLLNVNQEDILKLKRNMERLINYDHTQIGSKQFIPAYNTPQEDNFYVPSRSYGDERVNQINTHSNFGNRFKTVSGQGLTVSKENYFNRTDSQYLHYFVPNTNKLKLLHINQLNSDNVKWKTVKLAMNGEIPSFYKSIITPSGEIYLIGGVDGRNNQKRSGIFIFNPERSSLELVTDMAIPRSSHAVCYMNGSIYIIGGFRQNATATTIRQCEVFSIANRTCRSIGPLNNSCGNCSVSSFNNEYIFKFGGIIDNGEPCKYMEVYSVRDNAWSLIDPQFSLGERYTERFWINSFSAAVQINTSQIFIFGGYNNYDNESSSQMSYTLHVEKRGSDTVFSIKNIGAYQLPYAEGFWDNNPIILNNQVIALQNVSDADGVSLVLDQRKIIVFNGRGWVVV